MKGNKRLLIVFRGGGHAQVLIDELTSAGRSVLGATNTVLEVGEELAGLLPSIAAMPGGEVLNYGC